MVLGKGKENRFSPEPPGGRQPYQHPVLAPEDPFQTLTSELNIARCCSKPQIHSNLLQITVGNSQGSMLATIRTLIFTPKRMVYSLLGPPTTKTTDLSGLSSRNVLSYSSGSWEFRIKMLAGLIFGEDSLPSLQMAAHSATPLTALSVYTSRVLCGLNLCKNTRKNGISAPPF